MAERPKARDRVPQHVVWIPNMRQLRVVRAAAGVSVTQMCRDLGRSRQHLSAVLNGRQTSENTAKRIAEYFEKPLEDLFRPVDLENPDQATAA